MLTPKEVYIWMESIHDFDDFGFWEDAKTYIGSFEQIKGERDMAIEQLRELGYELGEKT